MKLRFPLALLGMLASTALYAGTPSPAHGRYLIAIGGCNDCHTPGFAAAKGQLPESQWLTGNPVGYRGPWGTSYAHNLRTHFAQNSEAEWLDQAKNDEMDPPMPYWALRAMSDDDLRDIYAFVHGLGAAGVETPDTVPFGQEPVGQYVDMTPKGTPAH